jgi:hypothetical protein
MTPQQALWNTVAEIVAMLVIPVLIVSLVIAAAFACVVWVIRRLRR